MIERKTCSAILMSALERFGESEATSVVVLFTDENGDVSILSNATRTQAVGLCEYGKALVLQEILGDVK